MQTDRQTDVRMYRHTDHAVAIIPWPHIKIKNREKQGHMFLKIRYYIWVNFSNDYEDN